MPVTPQQLRRYRAKIKELLNSSSHLDIDTVNRVQGTVEYFRDQVHKAIRQLKKTEALTRAEVDALKLSIGENLATMRTNLNTIMGTAAVDSQNLGFHLTTDPLDALDLGVKPIVGLTPEMAYITTQYSADLIQGVSEDVRGRINGQLERSLMGELTPYQAMQQVDEVLGVGKRTGVSYRAERIIRTEMTRAHSMGARVGLSRLGEQLEKDERKYLMKEWISAQQIGRTRPAHLAAHGQRVPYDKPFIVGGEELDFPGDPKGSPGNTINCLCRMVTFLDPLIEKREEKEIGPR